MYECTKGLSYVVVTFRGEGQKCEDGEDIPLFQEALRLIRDFIIGVGVGYSKVPVDPPKDSEILVHKQCFRVPKLAVVSREDGGGTVNILEDFVYFLQGLKEQKVIVDFEFKDGPPLDQL